MNINTVVAKLRNPDSRLTADFKKQIADLIEKLVDDRTTAINYRETDLCAWRRQTETARHIAGRKDEVGILKIISDLVAQTKAL